MKDTQLTQEEGNLSNPISIREMEFVVKNHIKKSGPNDLTGKFHQIFKEEIIQILHKLYKGTVREENYRQMFPTNTDQKILNKFLENQF